MSAEPCGQTQGPWRPRAHQRADVGVGIERSAVDGGGGTAARTARSILGARGVVRRKQAANALGLLLSAGVGHDAASRCGGHAGFGCQEGTIRPESAARTMHTRGMTRQLSTSASGKRCCPPQPARAPGSQPAGCAGARQRRPRCSAAALCRRALRCMASQRGAPTRHVEPWPLCLLHDCVRSRRLRAARRSALASPQPSRLLWRHCCGARSCGGLLPQLVGNAARGAPPAALRRCGAAAARALHPERGGGCRAESPRAQGGPGNPDDKLAVLQAYWAEVRTRSCV